MRGFLWFFVHFGQYHKIGKQMNELDDKEELSLLKELKELDMIENEDQLTRLRYLSNQSGNQ